MSKITAQDKNAQWKENAKKPPSPSSMAGPYVDNLPKIVETLEKNGIEKKDINYLKARVKNLAKSDSWRDLETNEKHAI